MNAPDPWPIKDTPNTHGMFMLGKKTLYLCHMPMFVKQDHYYQLTLQVRLDARSMKTYLADRKKNPREAYNLTNPESFKFTVPDLVSGRIKRYPAQIFRSYTKGGDPENEIVKNAKVTVERVVYFRVFNQNVPRPANLTYVLFGNGTEAHLDHYIAADPDFQHLLTLPSVPKWLSPIQLQAGVAISFPNASTPIGCTPPIAAGRHSVLFQGIPTASVTIEVGDTFWYSTGNMLNAKDPCAKGEMHHDANGDMR